MHISNHHIVYLKKKNYVVQPKYIQFLFVSQNSINLVGGGGEIGVMYDG